MVCFKDLAVQFFNAPYPQIWHNMVYIGVEKGFCKEIYLFGCSVICKCP